MRRRAFDHVDPYLAPPWSDPPEPSEEEERMSDSDETPQVTAEQAQRAAAMARGGGVMGRRRGWQDPSTDIENVNAAYRIEHELATVYREALQRILDHGGTHLEPCWALHKGDCADVFQEIARAALAFDPLSETHRPLEDQ